MPMMRISRTHVSVVVAVAAVGMVTAAVRPRDRPEPEGDIVFHAGRIFINHGNASL